ncbi:MAG: hypothetical protein Q7S37_03985 [bacterium]|nr:hypothetical protein [bacterium]
MAGKAAQIASTQKYLNVLAIRDGMVILNDGGIRTILEVGSLNFALKSEEEQNGMLSQYQQFLNSLKFPLQIVMQSKRLDLFSYLKMLKGLLEKQTNDLIRIQTEEYTTYVERLLTRANIMDKKFYVVVPYFPGGIEKNSMIEKVLGSKSKTGEIHFTKEKFAEYKDKLNERVNIVSGGLGSMGLRVTPLGTQQIIELLYSIYNPAEALSERMTEVGNLESLIVQSDLPTTSLGNAGAAENASAVGRASESGSVNPEQALQADSPAVTQESTATLDQTAPIQVVDSVIPAQLNVVNQLPITPVPVGQEIYAIPLQESDLASIVATDNTNNEPPAASVSIENSPQPTAPVDPKTEVSADTGNVQDTTNISAQT